MANDLTLADQYKNLRDEQSRLETQRLNIMFSSSAITAITVIVSQVTTEKILPSVLQVLLLISLIWGLSMYKSLSSQIFKTITYNVLFIENSFANKWLSESMEFSTKYPPIGKLIKKWTHIFTLLTIVSILLTALVIYNIETNAQEELKSKLHISPLYYYIGLGILQVVEIGMCFAGVFRYDKYEKYKTLWRLIRKP